MRATLQILEPELLERVIDEATSVLGKTGVLVEHRSSFERLVAAKARAA